MLAFLLHSNMEGVRRYLLEKKTAKIKLCDGSSDSAKRVLFVGNSLTFANSVPWAMARFAEERQGERPHVYQILKPGWTLEGHYLDGVYQKLLEEIEFDILVLQEQSGRSVAEPLKTREYADKLTHLARAGGVERIILFEPWADRGQEGIQEVIHENFDEIGRAIAAEVSPVGDSFFNQKEEETEIVLYAPDQHHASQHGSYLAACVLYNTIYNTTSENLPSTLRINIFIEDIATISISEADARKLQSIANTTTSTVPTAAAK